MRCVIMEGMIQIDNDGLTVSIPFDSISHFEQKISESGSVRGTRIYIKGRQEPYSVKGEPENLESFEYHVKHKSEIVFMRHNKLDK